MTDEDVDLPMPMLVFMCDITPNMRRFYRWLRQEVGATRHSAAHQVMGAMRYTETGLVLQMPATRSDLERCTRKGTNSVPEDRWP